MKLLPKQKVQSLVEDQRRTQIEEGVTLARKVDALRGKLADLEKQHNLFVMGMEDELTKKTGKLFEEIKSKETEVKLLEIKRAELLKPLDSAWEDVKAREQALVQKNKELENLTSNLKQKDKGIQEKNDKARETLNHIKIRERELERTFDKADQLKVEAEKTYLQKINDKDKQDKEFDERNRKVDLAESAIKSFQFTLLQRQEQIEMREEEGKAEKIRLDDMRKTLERAFNRIRNK